MLRFCLDRVMFENGRMKIPELQEKSGINKNTLYAIYNNANTRIDLRVLDRICGALDCIPGDLLERVPDEK